MKIFKYSPILLVVFLIACATKSQDIRYSGEGKFDDLLDARVECTKGLPTDAYGSVSCNALNSCLANEGWYRVEEGGMKLPPQYAISCFQ